MLAFFLLCRPLPNTIPVDDKFLGNDYVISVTWNREPEFDSITRQSSHVNHNTARILRMHTHNVLGEGGFHHAKVKNRGGGGVL